MLLLTAAALAWAAPLAAQDAGGLARPRLFTRAPGSTEKDPRIWLAAGTELLLFREGAPDRKGRALPADSTPQSGHMPPDSIATPPDTSASGATAEEYEASVGSGRDRYFIYARTPEGKLYWSVEPRLGSQPYFHTLDAKPLIRMAEVPAPHQARVSKLFPARASNSGNRPPTDTPPPPPEDNEGSTRWTDHPLALLAALALGLAGGWILRHRGLGRDLLSGLRGAQRNGMTITAAAPVPQHASGGGGGNPEAASPHPSRRNHDDGHHHSRQDASTDGSVPAELGNRLNTLQSEMGKEFRLLGGIVIERFELIEERLRAQSPSAQPAASARGAAADPVAASAPMTRGARGQVAEAFVRWCQTAGANVLRIRDFGDEIGRLLGSAADVQLVARDGDNNGIKFVSNGAGDPIDYWLVTVGRESMVLPRPLEDGFRELHPVYAGKAVPSSLRDITPALVRQDGTGWILEQPGEVT